MADTHMIDSSAGSKDPQRLIEIGPEEQWTPFLESINAIMLQEKKARQDNDSIKGSELCCKIVSAHFHYLFLTKLWLICVVAICFRPKRLSPCAWVASGVVQAPRLVKESVHWYGRALHGNFYGFVAIPWRTLPDAQHAPYSLRRQNILGARVLKSYQRIGRDVWSWWQDRRSCENHLGDSDWDLWLSWEQGEGVFHPLPNEIGSC